VRGGVGVSVTNTYQSTINFSTCTSSQVGAGSHLSTVSTDVATIRAHFTLVKELFQESRLDYSFINDPSVYSPGGAVNFTLFGHLKIKNYTISGITGSQPLDIQVSS